jgi:hypothetical protein
MPTAAKTRKPAANAAMDYFAGRSHDAWRRTLLKTNPDQKGKPRMRLRGGVMVDINQPWSKLDQRAQQDNMRAARDAYDAVLKFPNDREAASAYVHIAWTKRNKADPSQPKALFKPYRQLPEVEKDKDRAHVDNMKAAMAAVRKGASKKAPRKRAMKVAATVAVQVDAKAWRRLETAAQKLSMALGRPVAPEALMAAGMDAMTALSASVTAKKRRKKP